MIAFCPWKHLIIVAGVGLSLAGVSRGQEADRLQAEVLRLRIMLQATQAEMFSRAQLSPHGLMDPGVQSLRIYAAQLERRLLQSKSRLAKQDAESLQVDLIERFELISADVARMTEQLRLSGEMRVADPSWRRVNVDGKEYYLVPVRKEKRPSAFSGRSAIPDDSDERSPN